MSLYLKYRPQHFADVVGQESIVETLTNAIEKNGLTHAYLFSGSRGTGKTSLARIVAKALMCTALKNAEPCNACELCLSVQAGHLVDLIEIDAASNRGIDEIRELREKIIFAPSIAKVKVYIIDEVHMLTKEAFNALLKTLEEPPAHAYFILATTELHKIPDTILSRCQHFNFKRIGVEAIVGRLETIAKKEEIKAEKAALELLAEAAHGGLRDAVGLMEQMILDQTITEERVVKNLGLSGKTHLKTFLKAIQEKDIAEALEGLEKIHGEGQNLVQFSSDFIGFLREQMLRNLDDKKEVAFFLHLIDMFMEAKPKISTSPIPQLPLEMAVLKACDFEIKPRKAAASAATAAQSASSPLNQEGAASLQQVKTQWKQILDRVETPYLRTSLNDGEPLHFENGKLTLAFKSSSLMEKINSSTNQTIILKAFESVLGQKITLKVELKKITLDIAEEKSVPTSASIADMAKEVFGG